MDLPATLELWIRLGAFAGVLAMLIALEVLTPRRRQIVGRWRRWPGNFGLVALDTLILRILFPATAVGMALLAEERGWRLLDALNLPSWVEIMVSVVLLDLAVCSNCCSTPCPRSGASTMRTSRSTSTNALLRVRSRQAATSAATSA